MIIYFSGTGNSRYCAELFADKLNDEITNAFDIIKNGDKAELNSEKPWVFVSPTYAWQIPHIFKDFIKENKFNGSKKAYFVMTCGSDIGNAEKINKTLCEEKGFEYMGTLEVIMPENYIALFDAPNEKKAAQIIRHALPELNSATELVQKGESFPQKNIKTSDKLKSGMVNKAFYKFYVKAKAFKVSDDCVGCGKCSDNCVLNNITMKDGKPQWGDECTHCMACICGCPVSAIEYGNKSQGKPRYQCPEYKKQDL